MDKNYAETKKYKVIIDTDPGVDDSACLIYAFFDDNIEVKLLTTVTGNTCINKATRNLLHLLDLYQLDIPVAKGASKASCRESINAEFIHQAEGLGGYVPPTNTKTKIIDKDAIEAMYQVICNNDDVIILALGPQTNVAELIKRHPNAVSKISKIIFMGGSPFGHPDYPDHISFNISSDPEAFKIVLDSKIPLVMVPSDVGRRKAHLDEKFVHMLGTMNDSGKLLEKMYSMYWEPGYPDKRVATNDTLALFALVYPEIFTFKKVNVTVDLAHTPGKTFVDFCDDGKIDFIADVDRDAFLNVIISDLEKLNSIKL